MREEPGKSVKIHKMMQAVPNSGTARASFPQSSGFQVTPIVFEFEVAFSSQYQPQRHYQLIRR